MRRDIFGVLNAFRRQLERPRKDQRNGKTDDQQQNDEPDRPVWDVKKGKDLGRDLNQQPGDHRVGDRNLVDIAPF